MAQKSTTSSSGSDMPNNARLSVTIVRGLLSTTKRIFKDKEIRAPTLPTESHTAEASNSPFAASTSQLANAFTTMSLSNPTARQDSIFETSIAECGPQGVPPSPSQKLYAPDELANVIETTTFTIDATTDVAKTWLGWLTALGDGNVAYVRNLRVTVWGIEVRVRILESKRREVPRVEAGVEFTEEALKELSGDFQERLHGDVMRWLRRAFEDVRSRQWRLYGGRAFSRKEMNKIGKIAFRLRVACHEMVNRYRLERDKGKAKQTNVPSISSNEESAIEDSDDEDLGTLVGRVEERPRAEQRQRAMAQRVRTASQKKKAAFVKDELAFRKHAQTCDLCDCKWTEELDGHPDLYAHKVVNHGKIKELVLEKCGKAVEASCEEDCTVDDARGRKRTHP